MAATGGRSTLRLRGPQIIGRDSDLARMIGALSDSRGLVLVEGEAGIGKSRLVKDALALDQLKDKKALITVCPPFVQPATLGPIIELLRRLRDSAAGLPLSPLAGALRPFLPEWAAGLPPAPEPLNDPSAVRHRLIRAVAEVLDLMGTEVLVVEDVHWADETTLDLLLFLLVQTPHPLSLVLTYRPEDMPTASPLLRMSSRSFTGTARAHIALAPLSVPQISTFVSSMLGGGQVAPELAHSLHEYTGGLPLAIEECVQLLHERDDLVNSHGAWERRRSAGIDVPPTIRDAVTERVIRLSNPAQKVLRAAAVLMVDSDPAVLAATAGLDDLQARPAVHEAVHSRLLAEDRAGRIGFRHVLAARAVYDRLSATDLRRFHQRAALALETASPLPAERLAHHFREGQEKAKWFHYAEVAADLALATGAHQSATEHLHQILGDPELPAPTVARLAAKMPMLAGYAGLDQLVGTLQDTLSTQSLTAADRAVVRSQLGRMLLHAGEPGAAAEEFERALPDLEHDPATAVTAMAVLSQPHTSMLTVADHLVWLERADKLATASPLSEAERLSHLADGVLARLALGENSGWELSDLMPTNATSQAEKLHQTRNLLNIGSAAIQWGHHARARESLEQALALASLHGYGRIERMALGTMLRLDWATGHWEGLQEQAGTLAEFRDEPLVRLEAMLVSGLHMAARGRWDEAGSALRRVLEEGERRRIMDMCLEPAAALARLALEEDRSSEALALTDSPMRVVEGKKLWLWASAIGPARVDALLASGQVDEARRLTEAFTDGLKTLDAPGPHAGLALCRAALAEGLGQVIEAAELWGLAADSCANTSQPYDALRARERRARAILRAGSRQSGRSLLAEVREEYALLGADGDALRLDRMLRALGGPGPGRRGYGTELSPRELEVLRLMLAGLTTPEIGRRLFRSPKTVAAQLNSAMRKYGTTSRTALAVRATQAGIEPASL
ncbi:helix-turn-helix transcriptional regulator (plasmid) [Streptomyces sp. AHU1]|uniref:helix-turn-helix transcriptional regulator n=1 Tax=Streptomyces sp. AHU1 TaxID=3377215 RepID=UPI0038781029